MTELAIKDLELLNKALKNDPRVLRLDKLEKEIEKSEDVIAISEEVKKKEEILANAYSEKDKELANHSLYESKLKLDSLDITKRYNEAFIEVRDLYMQIDDIIFGAYRKKVPSIGELK